MDNSFHEAQARTLIKEVFGPNFAPNVDMISESLDIMRDMDPVQSHLQLREILQRVHASMIEDGEL